MFFRLVVIWRDVYRQALKYQMKLNNSKCDWDVRPEREMMSVIIPEIQKALQTAGDRLEESHALRNVTGSFSPKLIINCRNEENCSILLLSPFSGEEHFILGEYTDSVRVWRAKLCAEREKGQTLIQLF